MKRLAQTLGLLSVGFLLTAGSASATTVVSAPCPVQITSVELGCADLANDTIYLKPGLGTHVRRAVLAHERGHIFDYQFLDSTERDRIDSMLRWRQWNPEHFADAYGACHLSKTERRKAFPFATMGRNVKLCRVLPTLRH